MKKMKKVLAVVLTLAMALSMTTVAFAGQNAYGYGVSDESANGIVIKSEYEGFNPIIIHDSEYTIDGATITQITDGDGTVANDFAGYGSAIAVYGDSSVVNIKNSDVNISGVGALALFVDDGADVIVENSKFHSEGGTLYESYKNSPDQSTMVAPPWILGIMGTSRCTNLMGDNSSMTVIDSETTAAQWAILSTDSGTNMTLNVVNSYMGLTGADYALQEGGLYTTAHGTTGATANPYTNRSGYGTYTIGNSNQKFWGVDMEVGTYANIYTGGQGLYTAMVAGETINLLDANGKVVTTYTPTESKVTTIDSDTFGFMIHQGSNKLTVEKGTVVNSEYTSMLLKTGCTMDALVSSGAVLNPGNGILLQVLDNDDATTGMDVSTFSFYTTHNENAGWPTEGTNTVNSTSTFAYDDVILVGDIFNGSGWILNSVGAQKASPVEITLSGSTTLKGQISSTATIHVTKAGSDAIAAAPAGEKASEAWVQYQNCSFPIGQYYDIGQVANMVKSNGLNSVDVVIEDEAVWTVTADGIVRNVTASSNSIVADKPVTLTVEGTLTLDGQVAETDVTVGNVTYKLAPYTVEVEEVDVSAWSVGNVYVGYPDITGATSIVGTDKAVKIVDGNGNGIVDEGDAVLQYEASQMLGWVAADGTLYAPAGSGNGGGMGGPGGPGGPGGEGGGMGGPGGEGGGEGGASSDWYTTDNKLTLTVLDDTVVAPGTEGAVETTVDRLMLGSSDNLSSFSGGGHVVGGDDDYAFMAGLYVNGGEIENLVEEVVLYPITVGSFGKPIAAPRYATSMNENNYVASINDGVSWHNGVIYDIPGVYTMSGKITMDTSADGTDTNDFSGLGAAVMVNGKGVMTTIEDAVIKTTGVAKLALFTDAGAVSIVKNSALIANGGVIWDGYMSTADQMVMVSPPWVLGLGGNAEEPCNARTTNLMGDYSVAAYVDSYFYAKGWGALSVDSGTNMNMVTVNSIIEVPTSGYGAYNIGNSTEDYYGTTMDVSTYAIIMTGGETTWKSYRGGEEISVVQFGGETNDRGHGINGVEVAKVSSDVVEAGKVVSSKIISDNFGFMCHNNGSSGWNVVNILDGTEVETKDAIFLVKKVNAEFNVDNAKLSSADKGVILQIIDNDDDYVGLDFGAVWGEENGDYGHTVGGHMPTFNQLFTEEAGYSNEWIAESSAAHRATLTESEGDSGAAPANMPPMGPGMGGNTGPYDVADNWVVNYNMTNTVVEGDLWNSTGYVGSNPATTMNVNLGEGAEVKGIISAGAFSHDVKEATVGNGDWTGAEALGHVTNIVNSNGVNVVNVTVSDNAVWNVTGSCYVDTLSVTETGKVVVPKGVTLTVGEKTYTDTVIAAPSSGDKDDVANTGDITPVMSPVVVVLAVMVLALGVLFVTKRKA